MLSELNSIVLCFNWFHLVLISLFTPILSRLFFREVKDEAKNFFIKYMAVMFFIFLLLIYSSSTECKARGMLLIMSSVFSCPELFLMGYFFWQKF
jgi:amino acid permease